MSISGGKSKNYLVVFFLLCFLISWTCWLSVVILTAGSGSVSGFEPIIYIGVLGPFISSIIVTGLESGITGIRNFAAKIMKWNVGIPWLLASILIPPVVYVGAASIGILLGGDTPSLSITIWSDGVILFLYSIFLSGGLEEPGWRGYVLPKLESKQNPIRASILLGLVWVFWHFPLFLVPSYAISGGSIFGLLLIGIPISFIFTWLYNGTESVFVCILTHSLMNFLGQLLLVSSDNQQFGIVFLLILWTSTILLVIIFRRRKVSNG